MPFWHFIKDLSCHFVVFTSKNDKKMRMAFQLNKRA